MTARRAFLQKLAALGVSLPVLKPSVFASPVKSSQAVSPPVILISRGQGWGEKILPQAWDKFNESGSMLDAVELGANITELDPDDNSVGYGGLPDERGVVTLDASIMHGPTHGCGSVASMERIVKACSVARLVMERTNHVMLVGEGATAFARAHGFPEENLLTDRSRRIWLRWKENLSDKDDWLPPADGDYGLDKRNTGTINVLGVDGNGDISGITTTSGLFGKIHGRIGDSPIIGAGLYLDNEVGAAGATGLGEEVIRTCGSFLVIEYMKQGMSVQVACETAIQRMVDINGGTDNVNFNVKMVAISKAGEVGCASVKGSKDGPPHAATMSADGMQVHAGTWLMEWGD